MYSAAQTESKVMSRLDKLVQAPGILAASAGNLTSLEYRFSDETDPVNFDRWRQLFAGLAKLLTLRPDDDEARLVLGDCTLLLRFSNGIYVGVVARKGHPVVKSMQRMVRSAFRSFGVVPPESKSRYTPRPVSPTSNTTTSSTTAPPYVSEAESAFWKKPQ